MNVWYQSINNLSSPFTSCVGRFNRTTFHPHLIIIRQECLFGGCWDIRRIKYNNIDYILCLKLVKQAYSKSIKRSFEEISLNYICIWNLQVI